MSKEQTPWTTPQQANEELRKPIDLRVQHVRDYGPPNNFVPKEGKGFVEYDIVFENQIYEVKPFSIDEWLVEPGRTTDDIDQTMETWLQDIQSSFEDPEHSPYARKYGIEKQIPQPVARLLADVDLAGEYHNLGQKYENAQVNLAGRFRQDQAEMRERHIRELQETSKGGKKVQLRQRQQVELAALQKTFNTDVRPIDKKKRDTESIGNFIKRKFIFDFFSPSPDDGGSVLVQQLPSIITQLDQVTDGRSQATYGHNNFFDEVTTFLQTTTDRDLLFNYNYKPHDELSGRAEDFAVLHPVYNWIFNPQITMDHPEEQARIQDLGKAMIRFLKNSALAKSDSVRSDHSSYHTLSLMFDMYNGILALGKASLYRDFANFFNSEFNNVPDFPNVIKECKALRDNFYLKVRSLVHEGLILHELKISLLNNSYLSEL